MGNWKRRRRTKKTDQEKFDILVKYKKEHPDEDIKGDTVDENGDEIGKDRQYLQVAYNRGDVDLTEEQIKQLKDLGILNLSDKEKGKTAGEYGISKTLVKITIPQFFFIFSRLILISKIFIIYFSVIFLHFLHILCLDTN